jgi:SAM-dependent methyltransferase
MGVLQSTTSGIGVDYFESVYQSASGEASLVPWCEGKPSAALVNWLNAMAPSIVRCGSRVAVVGCGLADDAREFLRRGYEVTAFDASQTAVRWAKRLDPSRSNCYVCADLFKPLPRWRHRFDLVAEVNNLAWLHPEQWSDALRSIGELLTPHGHLLLINPATTTRTPIEAGPPWPIEEKQLLEAAARAGLTPAGKVSAFEDDDDPSQLRMRAMFRRA